MYIYIYIYIYTYVYTHTCIASLNAKPVWLARPLARARTQGGGKHPRRADKRSDYRLLCAILCVY